MSMDGKVALVTGGAGGLRQAIATAFAAQGAADAVVFLASPQADLITGITLPVDGGWTAW